MIHTEPSASPRTTVLLRAAVAAWAVAALAGLGALGAHAARPGSSGAAASHWPGASRVPRPAGRPTLLLFVDAGCPCASASLGELARLLGRAPGAVDAFVVASGDVRAAGSSAGAKLVADPGAEEAGRFGVATSGHVLLFDADGRLLFSGGITPARGHQGDNFGAAAVAARLAGRAAPSETPIFGCPIEAKVAAGGGTPP
jgi:hypothetical protein